MTVFAKLYCPKRGRDEDIYKVAKHATKIYKEQGGDIEKIYNVLVEIKNIINKNTKDLSKDYKFNDIIFVAKDIFDECNQMFDAQKVDDERFDFTYNGDDVIDNCAETVENIIIEDFAYNEYDDYEGLSLNEILAQI